MSTALPDRRYRLGPLVIDLVERAEMIDTLVDSVRGGKGLCAGYVNAHIFEELHGNPELAEAMRSLDLVFCDGVGARLGLRFLGVPVPERMATPDFIDEIFTRLREIGSSVFLLGDEPQVAKKMAEAVTERFGEMVAGYHHGYFGPEEEHRVAGMVRESGAGMVLVAMGCPRQEIWMARHRGRLSSATSLAVGGMFRWYTGHERRGPRWMTDRGFEWLFRLIVQPRRVAKRYLLGLPRFGARILGYRLRGVRGDATP